jgi:hypothetical protein
MSMYRSIRGIRQCVFCGSADEEQTNYDMDKPPVCGSCNAHGPFGAGWPAAESSDLAEVRQWRDGHWAPLP